MTQSLAYEVKCPCGEVFKAELYDSVNATLNPELMGMLFNDELNRVKCPGCGQIIWVDSPLLYHDMNQRLMVYYFPKNCEDIGEDEEAFRERIVATLERHALEGYEYDVAIGMKELNRKVLWRHY
jgi:hypothetical protein